jgi:hypothetical protein
MNAGTELNLVIRFLNGESTGTSARLRCQILREELQPDGRYGLAMAIKEHKFL